MQVNMVVNYDLPLMNERVKGADERPDIETYIHRIGKLSQHYHEARIENELLRRSNGSLWAKGYLHQLRA
jgi:superfamily II DNA/RNA helicase